MLTPVIDIDTGFSSFFSLFKAFLPLDVFNLLDHLRRVAVIE